MSVAVITGLPADCARLMRCFRLWGHPFEGDLDPEVPACDHDAVELLSDGGGVLHRLRPLDLGQDRQAQAERPGEATYLLGGAGTPDERETQPVNPAAGGKGQGFTVASRDGGDRQGRIREVDPLVRQQGPTRNDTQDNDLALPAEDTELQAAVVEENPLIWANFDQGVRFGDADLRNAPGSGTESHLLPLGQRQRLFQAGPKFGAGQVEQDCHRP